MFESVALTPAWGVANCSMGAFGCGYAVGGLLTDPKAPPGWGVGPGDVGCVPGGFNLLGAATVLNCIAQRIICNQVVASCDPNDIIGPKGYGEGRYVSRSEVLPYTIRYENDPEAATAPAQKVEIRQVLDSDLNPLTFRVKDFGFADYVFAVEGNVSSYFNTVDLPDSLGYDLEVTAGIDIEKNEAFWILQTIDSKTGLPPADPLKGFLALNDSTGAGEGFVNYTIKAKNNAITGDSILALAEIVFDINAPIITPEIFNIIDAEPPVSKVKVLGIDSDSITVTAEIEDDFKGSGAKAYDLYVSEGNGDFKLVASDLPNDSTFKIASKEGEVYCLYAVSKDNVNNKEAQKPQADTCFISTGVVTGTVTPKVEGTFILYPNPSDGYKFNVLITGLEIQETVTLEVVDVLGRSMFVTDFRDAAYFIDSEVKLSPKLDPGIYFVNCYTKKGKSVKKMVVER
ncbi:hypothetical protein MYP_4079 [Sporocytophaga myxococcoides]|uniref:Uncharacterized protein n=1 Tax=Sporocytophaga myxococcoides TaxID=153721 RepID=A0A098LK59_9BACT|nr:hypothetical protein MYP_4079 [Sporocytophaga myxococcoides]